MHLGLLSSIFLGMEYRMTEAFEQAKEEKSVSEPNVYYWSCMPGKFVNKHTGKSSAFPPVKRNELVVVSETVLETTPKTVVRVLQEKEVTVPSPGPQFHGNVREWYETLAEVFTEVGNDMFKKNLIYPAILEVGEHGMVILGCLEGYRANVEACSPIPLTNGEYVGVFRNRFAVVKSNKLASDEIKIVLISDKLAKEVGRNKDGDVPLVETTNNPNGNKRIDETVIKILDSYF